MITIDSDDYKESGIETMFFPGGEPHAKLPEFHGAVMFFAKLRTWNDVGLAAMVLSALTRQLTIKSIIAFIPYFPGARQDRTDGKAPFTVEDILRFLYTPKVALIVFDGHSKVLTENGRVALNFMPENTDVPLRDGVVGIIAPDEGAKDRALTFRDKFYPEAELVSCTKERDAASGKLSNYVMPALPQVGRYIIVDDICDGGGTFNLLADAFAKDPLAFDCKLEMFVSHGIFSKGLPAISDRIEHITTTDSFCRLAGIYPNRLTVIPLLPQLNRFLGEANV